MKYAIDCEFIDTPSCSALISLAVVREDLASCYFEFEYPIERLTPWLKENVVPHLQGGQCVETFSGASRVILQLMGDDKPEFWAYYGAYDWYWFARLFGGFMRLPNNWPRLYNELAATGNYVPVRPGAPAHNALNDAKSLMQTVVDKGLRPDVR